MNAKELKKAYEYTAQKCLETGRALDLDIRCVPSKDITYGVEITIYGIDGQPFETYVTKSYEHYTEFRSCIDAIMSELEERYDFELIPVTPDLFFNKNTTQI